MMLVTINIYLLLNGSFWPFKTVKWLICNPKKVIYKLQNVDVPPFTFSCGELRIEIADFGTTDFPATTQRNYVGGTSAETAYCVTTQIWVVEVLGFISHVISVILILTRGIAVSSSSVVCGFSSFWLTVFGVTVYIRYRLFALSFRYDTDNTQNKTQ